MADSLLFPIVLETRAAEQQAFAAHKRIASRFNSPIPIKFNSKGPNGLGQITADLSEFDKSLQASNARVLAFGATTGVIFAVQRAFRALLTDAIQVEKQLKDIQVVLGATTSQVKEFSKGLFDVARTTGQSFSVAAEAAAEFSRQGLGLAKTLEATQAALTLVRISGVDAESAVQSLTAAVNTFNKEGVTHVDVVSKIIALDVKFAVSAQDLAEGLKRAGSVASDTGTTMNELNAAITTVQEVTARGGAVIGNGFKSIATRLQRAGIRETLEGIGVSTQKSNGDLRSTIDVLRDLANTIDSVEGGEREGIIEKVGGVFQINTLRALLNQLKGKEGFSAFDDAKKTAEEASSSIIARNEELNESFAALASQTRNSIQEFNSILAEKAILPPLKGGTNFVKELVDGLIGAQEGEYGAAGEFIANGILNGIRNVLSGPAPIAIIIGLSKIIQNITKDFGQAFKSIAGITGQTEKRLQLERQVASVLSQASSELQQQIASTSNLTKQQSLFNQALDQTLVKQAKSAAIISNLASGVSGTRAANLAFTSSGRGGRSRAEGHLPALAEEQFKINKGIGGATKNAKPLIKSVNIGKGVENVAVNNQELIVKNFLGGKQDAILTPDMLRKIGGKNAARQMSFADGSIDDDDKFVASTYQANQANKANRKIGRKIARDKALRPSARKATKEPFSPKALTPKQALSSQARRVEKSPQPTKARTLTPSQVDSRLRSQAIPFKPTPEPFSPKALAPSEVFKSKATKGRTSSDAVLQGLNDPYGIERKKIGVSLAETAKAQEAIAKTTKKINAFTKLTLDKAKKGESGGFFTALNSSLGGPTQKEIISRGVKAGMTPQAAKELALQSKGEKSRNFNDKVSTKALTAGIVASIGGGFIEEAFRKAGNDKGADVTAGVSQGASIAATAASFGKNTGLFGLGIGTVLALNSSFEALTENSKELVKDFKELQEESQAQFSFAAQANNNRNTVDNLVAAGADPRRIEIAVKELTSSLNNITDDRLRSIVLSGDSEENKAIQISQLRNEDQKQLQSKEFSALFTKAAEDSTSLFDFKANIDDDQLKDFARLFIQSRGGVTEAFNKANENSSESTLIRIREAIEEGNFELEEIGLGLTQEQKEAINSGSDPSLRAKLLETLTTEIQRAFEQEALSQAFVDLSEETFNAKKAFSELSKSLTVFRSIGRERRDANFDIGLNSSKLALENRTDFITPEGKRKGEFDLKALSINRNRNNENEDFRDSLADSLSETIISKNKGTPPENIAILDFIAEFKNGTLTITDLLQRIKDESTNDKGVVGPESVEAARNAVDVLTKIDIKYDKQLEFERQSLEAFRKSVALQENLKFLGGISSLINDDPSETKQKNNQLQGVLTDNFTSREARQQERLGLVRKFGGNSKQVASFDGSSRENQNEVNRAFLKKFELDKELGAISFVNQKTGKKELINTNEDTTNVPDFTLKKRNEAKEAYRTQVLRPRIAALENERIENSINPRVQGLLNQAQSGDNDFSGLLGRNRDDIEKALSKGDFKGAKDIVDKVGRNSSGSQRTLLLEASSELAKGSAAKGRVPESSKVIAENLLKDDLIPIQDKKKIDLLKEDNKTQADSLGDVDKIIENGSKDLVTSLDDLTTQVQEANKLRSQAKDIYDIQAEVGQLRPQATSIQENRNTREDFSKGLRKKLFEKQAFDSLLKPLRQNPDLTIKEEQDKISSFQRRFEGGASLEDSLEGIGSGDFTPRQKKTTEKIREFIKKEFEKNDDLNTEQKNKFSQEYNPEALKAIQDKIKELNRESNELSGILKAEKAKASTASSGDAGQGSQGVAFSNDGRGGGFANSPSPSGPTGPTPASGTVINNNNSSEAVVNINIADSRVTSEGNNKDLAEMVAKAATKAIEDYKQEEWRNSASNPSSPSTTSGPLMG